MKRLTTPIAILFLTSLAFGCSVLPLRKSPTWHITLQIADTVPDREAATLQAVRVIEARLDAMGLLNSKAEAEGTPPNGRIRVSIPGVPDRERVKRLLTTPGRLELAHVISLSSPAPVSLYATKEEAIAAWGKPSADRRVLPYSERSQGSDAQPSNANQGRKWIVVESPAIVEGSELRNASAVRSQGDDDVYVISFSLKPDGAMKFGEWTASHINEYMAVVFNDEVKSVAYIKTQITDSGEIAGHFTRQAAEDVALLLRSGALPEVKIVEEGASK